MTVSSQAMQYDADPSTPLPDCISIVNLTPENVMLAASSEPPHMARVIAGLLFAACGGLDVAHNLVTPLCWSSWTPYAGQCVLRVVLCSVVLSCAMMCAGGCDCSVFRTVHYALSCVFCRGSQ